MYSYEQKEEIKGIKHEDLPNRIAEWVKNTFRPRKIEIGFDYQDNTYTLTVTNEEIGVTA